MQSKASAAVKGCGKRNDDAAAITSAGQEEGVTRDAGARAHGTGKGGLIAASHHFNREGVCTPSNIDR
jgi:hypothetical protein